MKTALIHGARPAAFDAGLLQRLELTAESTPQHADDLRLGVRNEYGQIYRSISFRNMYDFLAVIARLRAAGYVDTEAGPDERRQGFDAVIGIASQPRREHSRAVPVAYADGQQGMAGIGD